MPDRHPPLSDDGDQGSRSADEQSHDDLGDATPARGQHAHDFDTTPTRNRRQLDDDVETPPRGMRTADDADGSGDLRDNWDDDDEWAGGNKFTMRRILIASAAVGVVVLGVIGGRALFGGDDSPSDSDPASWNTVATLTGSGVTLVNRNGSDEIAAYPLDADPLDLQSELFGNVLVTLADDGRVVQTDLADGTDTTVEAGRNQTLRIAPDNSSIAIIASEAGGDVTIIDTVRQRSASIAEATEITEPSILADDVRINAGGTHLAVAIPQLFQSFLIDLETSQSIALAGRALAIDNERVVTEQPAGSQSEIEFYALDGERLGSVDVAAPRASMIAPDGSMLLITADGAISRADPDGTKDVGELVDPDGRRIEVVGGLRTAGGERLVAIAENFVFVVDADGRQVAAIPGRLADPPPTINSQCLVIATGTTTIGVTVIDLETGTTLAETDRGIVTATSTDGCTVATSGATSPQLIADGTTVDVDADAIIAVAPDGSAYVTIDGRKTSLVTKDSEPVVLASEPAIVRFGRR
jgi:hypothetical protein